SSHGTLAAGSYFFPAQYFARAEGSLTDCDVTACEPCTIGTSKPTIGTTLKNAADDSTIVNGSTIGLGSSVYDTAQLGNGGGFGFTGSVTYKFYSRSEERRVGREGGCRWVGRAGREGRPVEQRGV